MELVLTTPFARYRLSPAADVRAVQGLELRTLLAQLLADEGGWRADVRRLCEALEVTQARDRTVTLETLVRRLSTLGGPMLVREERTIPRPIKDELELPEPQEGRSEDLEWIEIVLIDEDDQPVPGISYHIKLSDGRIRRGVTNINGVFRYDHIPGGICEVTFTDLDGRDWRPA